MEKLSRPSSSPRFTTSIALLAFAFVCFHWTSNAQQSQPTTVSVCDLVDSPKKFNGKYVRLRAKVSSDGIERTNLRDDACQKGVALFIPHDIGDEPDVAKLEDALYRRGSPGTVGKEIEGTFEGHFEWRPKETPRTHVLVLKTVSDLKVKIK